MKSHKEKVIMKAVLERIIGIDEFDNVKKKASFICEELEKSHSSAFNEILSFQLIEAEFIKGPNSKLPSFMRNEWPALK